jgi:CheY-like chemotaxis protein
MASLEMRVYFFGLSRAFPSAEKVNRLHTRTVRTGLKIKSLDIGLRIAKATRFGVKLLGIYSSHSKTAECRVAERWACDERSALSRTSRGGRIHVAMPAIQKRVIMILSVSAALEDHDSLRRILEDPLWPVHIATAGTCQEAMSCLRGGRTLVVLCDIKLPDGSWKDILNNLSELSDAPVLIVTSGSADDHLWAEVLNLGGFDVLAKPFRKSEVRYALAAACRRKDMPLAVKVLAASG